MAKAKEIKKVLLKDIVIPKGTVLTLAPRISERHGDDHFAATIGLSKNTSGDFTYCIDDDPEIMAEYFATLIE